MQIKSGLNQFKGGAAILAVAGDKRAKFYVAGDGEINLAAEIEELTPEYEDNEGFFGGKKGGKLSRMGNPDHEVNKEYLLNKFAKKFEEEIKNLEGVKNSAPIYLFAPAFIHTMLSDSLPKVMAKRIILNIPGNQLKAKPFDLIEMIAKNTISGKVVTKEKARKLLSK
jgi:hypothetical protein